MFYYIGGVNMSDLGNKEIMGKNIQRLMDNAGISRTKLSDDLDIAYTTITSWINGESYPRIDKIELMAAYFGVSKSELVERQDGSRNINAEMIAAHVDSDTTDAEREEILQFMEYLKTKRPKK